MQFRKNFHRYIWILSGTSDGLRFVKVLIDLGWKVSVSVVTSQAALPYLDLHLDQLWIGPLDGVGGILDVLKQAKDRHKGFDWVLDATHPFASVISLNLSKACSEMNQPLVRFERPCYCSAGGNLIDNPLALADKDIEGQRILFAIGARGLCRAVNAARKAKAEVFARVLPSPESLRLALSCNIPEKHLAVLRPFSGEVFGGFESALCRRWSIDAVVCRQSGGQTQKLWEEICQNYSLQLWLISRPLPCVGGIKVHNSMQLLNRVLNS